MKRVERVAESEATFTLNDREWSLIGWKADLLFGIPLAVAAFCFVVGVVTTVGWLL